MRSIVAFVFVCCFFSLTPLNAELVLSVVGTTVSENFDGYRGNGFAPNPGAGQLDSDTYRAVGFSNVDGVFGGTFTSDAFARGTSSGGVTTGGTYAFDIGGSDYTLGVQPTDEEFTPGALTIKVTNQTGVDLNFLRITADALIYNDTDASTTWTFGGALFDAEANYGIYETLVSPAAADSAPAWESTSIGGLIDLQLLGGNLANENDFFIQVANEDLAALGDRDEFALNNLRITGYVTAIPEPSPVAVCLAVCCIPILISRRRFSR
jgi:hypothetical protein